MEVTSPIPSTAILHVWSQSQAVVTKLHDMVLSFTPHHHHQVMKVFWLHL